MGCQKQRVFTPFGKKQLRLNERKNSREPENIRFTGVDQIDVMGEASGQHVEVIEHELQPVNLLHCVVMPTVPPAIIKTVFYAI